MRKDGTFIAIEVEEARVADGALAAKLDEVCPVDIYADAGGRVDIVESNIDECVLCRLCIDASPPGAVRVIKRYDDDAVLA
jgi:NAD-dependent dihydropyrimidine dehydrogenase PreA subunit